MSGITGGVGSGIHIVDPNAPNYPRELRGPSGLSPELQAFQSGGVTPYVPGSFGAAMNEAMVGGVSGPGGTSSPFQVDANGIIGGPSGAAFQNPLDSLGGMAQKGIDAVNADMERGDASAQAFVRGEEIAVHEVMLAMTKADTSFRLMTTMGRKAIEAYQEIMRLQV
jgi:flagellar hook-basal body complex protein FliE